MKVYCIVKDRPWDYPETIEVFLDIEMAKYNLLKLIKENIDNKDIYFCIEEYEVNEQKLKIKGEIK